MSERKPRLDGKVAVVTGGAYGLGYAYCLGLAAEGAKVVIADVNEKAALKTAAEMQEKGMDALAVKTDVSDVDSTLAMTQQAIEAFGKIDILVNNAAIFGRVKINRVPFYELDLEEWDKVMAVNLKGTLLCSRAVFPSMRDQNRGKIINISSSGVLFGNPNYVHYVASKAGVVGLTRSLARELGEFNINVNCILPGATVTEDPNDQAAVARRLKRFEERLLPKRCLKNVQYPDSLVGTVIFLASGESDFMTGQSLVVDGGDMLH